MADLLISALLKHCVSFKRYLLKITFEKNLKVFFKGCFLFDNFFILNKKKTFFFNLTLTVTPPAANLIETYIDI